MSKTYTVTEAVSRLKTTLESGFPDISVSGEISFRDNAVSPAGHFYFSLKDENSQLKCVMWNREFAQSGGKPANGSKVTVSGRMTVYARGGDMQLSAKSLLRTGLGELMEKLKKLRAELVRMKMTDENGMKIGARPIPLIPASIGVVTSPTGAAIRDILSVIERRFANVEILIYPVRVQGEGAAAEIAAAIDELNAHFPDLDVLLVGRGGGSIEDLWAFNEEPVVRSIFSSKIPVISCVGHEIDYTLADCVADLRAPTPSAAAELVVKNKAELTARLSELKTALSRRMLGVLSEAESRFRESASRPLFSRPGGLYEAPAQRADLAAERLFAAAEKRVREAENRLELAAQKLMLLFGVSNRTAALAALSSKLSSAWEKNIMQQEHALKAASTKLTALSPLGVLKRGYSVTFRKGTRTVVKDAGSLAPGDGVTLVFGRGKAGASVTDIEIER